MNPPTGDYIVGWFSPDREYTASSDPRIQEWLTNRGIDYSTVYEVQLSRLGGWVFRWAQDESGQGYTECGNNVARREAEWVLQ